MPHSSLFNGGLNKTYMILDFPPHHLTTLDIFYIVLLVAWKHISALLGLRKAVRPSTTDDTYDLPALSVTAPLQITEADLEAWQLAVGERSMMLPVAITTPMMLLLLASPMSPILPLGAVNTKNRLEFLHPTALHLNDGLLVSARFGGSDLKGRMVKRGMDFDVIVEIIDPSRPVNDQVVLRQIISTLQFMKTKTKSLPTASLSDEVVFPDEQVEMKLDINAPSRWAAVCKDYNPIHMSSLAAKLFGFPSKIAHGNHVVALVIGMAIVGEATEWQSLRSLWWETERPNWVEVTFKRPTTLPATVAVKVSKGDGHGTVNFVVLKGTKVSVTGQAGYL